MPLTPPSPLTGTPLSSREDFREALLALTRPLARHTSAAGARVRLGAFGAHYPDAAAELEGFARPLWGLAALAAAENLDLSDVVRGLDAGTNPDHPEYWGEITDGSQLIVEAAAIAFALVTAPHALWTPLDPSARRRVVRWLTRVNHVYVGHNNWQWFRVLVNVALERLGERHDSAALSEALERLDRYYEGGGWYADGAPSPDRAQLDYYVAFAMHYYGLVYAALRGDRDPIRALEYRSRAARFALDFQHWFGADGAALPFGRSLTYRFAMGAFWGALAFADVEALPWGELRGLWARHLRWWSQRPIFSEGGLLTVGYAYPNLMTSEEYNSPQSPYWALKFFLPLALPATHPFWTTPETPQRVLAERSEQPEPGMIVCRDPAGADVYALSGRQHALWLNHGRAKYAKFAYSTRFGFSVSVGDHDFAKLAPDSVLALSDDGRHYRAREHVEACAVSQGVVHTRWRPWPDVTVHTLLVPATPWHVRIHQVRSARTLSSAEGGWAAPRDDAAPARPCERGALCVTPGGASGVLDLGGERQGLVIAAAPNTNVVHPRTWIPALVGTHPPGEYVLVTAVLGADAERGERAWRDAPQVELTAGEVRVSTLDRTVHAALSFPPQAGRDGGT